MHAQLAAIVQEFDHASERLHALAAMVPDDQWPERPDPARWSVSECVAHLNLTADACLPLIRDAIARGRKMPVSQPGRYRRGLLGWMLWKSMSPPVRMRTKTISRFVPASRAPKPEVVEQFDRLQEEQVSCIREADGLPLSRLIIVSPFDPRVRYNLFACFSILARHEHRHLWQAERAYEDLSRGKG